MEKITYRLAQDGDVDKINRFYNSAYKSNRTRLQFEWEFNASPAGKAIYVIADYNGEIIGTQCVIPYFIINAKNQIFLSGKSEDTLVSPLHRGKNIFEKMYALLLEECKRRNILFVWGFTYAAKPFLKLGFQIPFQAGMGILVLKPGPSAAYFSSLSPKNAWLDRFKIRLLTLTSKLKSSFLITGKVLNVDFEKTGLNTENFNYLKYDNAFGLKLDEDFLKYRVYGNPYNQNYVTCNYRHNGVLLISLVFNITKQNVGYLIHLYISDAVTIKVFKAFLRTVIRKTALGKCIVLRFWGFAHNRQNKKEMDMLGSSGFMFIRRGISFVWLPLNTTAALNPGDFVLSRLSSQGTD